MVLLDAEKAAKIEVIEKHIGAIPGHALWTVAEQEALQFVIKDEPLSECKYLFIFLT